MEGLHPEYARAYLRVIGTRTAQPELVEAYIKEAEHQEGEGYWARFADAGQLLADVLLWIHRDDARP